MEKLDLDIIEGQFGLMLREKENHDNYILLRFEDLQKIVDYFAKFKKETKYDVPWLQEQKFCQDNLGLCAFD